MGEEHEHVSQRGYTSAKWAHEKLFNIISHPENNADLNHSELTLRYYQNG